MLTDVAAGPFAMLLRQHRAAAGLSQEELAERAGLSRRGISDLERGERRSPHPVTVRRLALALDLDSDAQAAFLASAQPQLAVPPRRAANSLTLPPLPVLPGAFVGRELELSHLRRLLDSSRLLTLTGAGGDGKTRIARQLAAEALRDSARGVVWVDLGALTEPEKVPHRVAVRLGLAEHSGRPPVDALAEELQQRRLFLVLDGCDHVRLACAELADRLFVSCPQVTVLATSRVALGAARETSWSVPPLSLPPALGSGTVWGPPHLTDGQQRTALEDIARSDAVRLFVARAEEAKSGYRLTAVHAPLAAQLCRCLDGIPLALEVTAARVAALPVELVAEQLRNAIRPLASSKQTPLPREQTLQLTLDWSYKLLSDEERRLLTKLSIFAGGWTLEAAEAVCVDNGMDAEAVVRCMEVLVATALVLADLDGDGRARYQMPEPVREYAKHRLNSTDWRTATPNRHLDWCMNLVAIAKCAADGFEQGMWRMRLEREDDNLRAALAWRDRILHVHADLDQMVVSPNAHVTWTAVDTTAGSNIAFADAPLNGAIANSFNSQLSLPQDFPVGTYRVDFYMDANCCSRAASRWPTIEPRTIEKRHIPHIALDGQ